MAKEVISVLNRLGTVVAYNTICESMNRSVKLRGYSLDEVFWIWVEHIDNSDIEDIDNILEVPLLGYQDKLSLPSIMILHE